MLSEAQKTAIRHLTPPAADRQMTKQELADLLGITVRAIQKWETGNREFIAALEKSRDQYQSDPNYFERIARFHTMEALLQGALMKAESRDELNHKRACMKEILAQTKHVAENTERVDVSSYTDAELLEMALTADINVDGFSKADLEKVLKEGDAK